VFLFVQYATVCVLLFGVAAGASKPEADHKQKRQTEDEVGIPEILSQIDREIALLQQARALLTGTGKAATAKSSQKPAKSAAKKKRVLTPEGRRRIAEAVKRRWAEQRKAAQSKQAGK